MPDFHRYLKSPQFACAGVARVLVAKGKANLFLDGNPIVYGGAIESIQGEPATGDPVVVCDWKNAAIAWGIYNTDSMFRVRIMQLDREVRSTFTPTPVLCQTPLVFTIDCHATFVPRWNAMDTGACLAVWQHQCFFYSRNIG